MKTYVVRFQAKTFSGHAEVLAETVIDAWEDFKRKNPEYKALSAHEKPVKTWVGC